jgi:hypothetical protein
MNAIRDMYGKDKTEKAIRKPNLTVVKNETAKEETKYTTEYLNEKMYHYYNNGGPAMDI